MPQLSPKIDTEIRRFLERSSKPLIVVLGPTASGKTSFSLELASIFEKRKTKYERTEIVNSDSRQLYKYMDIGTAKIKPKEMRGIPHHLLDVLDPKEEVTVAWYKKHATETIAAIHGRRNVPMLVGGSMLYISAVIDNLQFLPATVPATRKRLEKEYERDGGTSLFKRLQERDPETAEKFSKNNKPYVIRAMEILETVGKPSSVKQKGESLYDLLIFGMEWPREELIKRINQRTRRQFEGGWIDEVKALLKKGYTADDPGMRSQGYREIAAAISNAKLEMQNGKLMDALTESISAQARQYAKRQMTWWRRDPRIQWKQSNMSRLP